MTIREIIVLACQARLKNQYLYSKLVNDDCGNFAMAGCVVRLLIVLIIISPVVYVFVALEKIWNLLPPWGWLLAGLSLILLVPLLYVIIDPPKRALRRLQKKKQYSLDHQSEFLSKEVKEEYRQIYS